jgi:hypothetical protein
LGALTVAVAAPLLAPSAGAVVANPGSLQVSMRLSVFTPTFTVAGVASNGSGNATLRTDGLVKIPQSSISFQPINVQIALPDPSSTSTSSPGGSSAADSNANPAVSNSTITVQVKATSAFTGGINPKNGSAFLLGNVEEVFTQPGTIDNCVVGPFRIAAGTSTAGGIAYSQDSGSVTVVDPNYEIDAISTGSNGCDGFEGAINAALSLPVTTTTTTTTTLPPGVAPIPPSNVFPTQPPVPSVVVSLTFTPAPREAIAPPPVGHGPGPTNATQTTTVGAPVLIAPGGQTPGNPQPSQVHRRQAHKPQGNPNKKHHPAGNPNKKHHPKPAKEATAKVKKVKQKHKHGASGTYLPGAAAPKARTKARATASAAGAGPSSRQLSFVTASFVKRPASALSTGLDLVGLIGLLIFSSLALWLVTSEMSALSANARRQRTHRIAGITR